LLPFNELDWFPSNSGVYKDNYTCQWNLIIKQLQYFKPATSFKLPSCLVSLAWAGYQANSSLHLV
jgi:hypothetical protein